MSSDNQYTALGPAPIGFQTFSTGIDTGAQISGNSMGIDAKGPIGVRGIGVPSDTGLGPIGVEGQGQGGPGGRFSSTPLFPQLHLDPDKAVVHNLPMSETEIPQQIPKWGDGLPWHGKLGDLWLVNIETEATPVQPSVGMITLWLCVHDSNQVTAKPALWKQVLLGTNALPGTQGPTDL